MIIKQFNKTYKDQFVLNFPDLEFIAGKIYSIVGPNGSGKTTFAKVISGIIKPDNKTIILNDDNLKIGYLPQKSYAFRMNTLRNVTIGCKNMDRANYLMSALQIDSLALRSAKKLSGGETAKMALARLLMNNYDLLVLDEPTASMDMESTILSESLIKEYTVNNNCISIVITHSLSEAKRLSDYFLFIKEGSLIEHGATCDVLSNPSKDDTKQFLEFYGN